MTPPALQLSGIRERLSGVMTLDRANLPVRSGTVHAFLGENGAAESAALYHTTDLDELIEIADRIVVVFEGRVREVAPDGDDAGRAPPGAA